MFEKSIDKSEIVNRLLERTFSSTPVSYTHLDVYKRQLQSCPWKNTNFILEYSCKHNISATVF